MRSNNKSVILIILVLLLAMEFSIYITKDQQVTVTSNEMSIKDEVNSAIIDGFFDGDTVNKDMSNVYFMQ